MGWSASELGRRAKLSRSWVGDFERGLMTNPRPLSLEALAHALGWKDWKSLIESDALTPPRDLPIRGNGQNVVRDEQRAAYVTAPPALTYASAYRPIYFAAFAAERLANKEGRPDAEGHEIPPPEYRDALGVDPIGVIIEGSSLAGLGVKSGMVAWVNTTDRPYYSDGDLVLANVRETESSDLTTVIKQVLRVDGRQALYSVKVKGKPERYDVAECWVLARVVCLRDRTPMLPKAFTLG